MAITIGNIDWPNGKVNPSGIVPIAHRISKKEIESWPVIEDDAAVATTVAGYANYTGDFVLVTGKKWETIYSTQGKGKVTFEPTGEADAKMFINKGTLSFPDLTDEIRSLAKMAVNGDYIYLIQANNRYHVIGSPDYRVSSAFAGDSGDAAGSAKGVTITLECPDVTPLPLYKGELVTAAGTLDIETGVFTPAGA